MAISIISDVLNEVRSFVQNDQDSKKTVGDMKAVANLIAGKSMFKLDAGVAREARRNIASFPMLCSDTLEPEQVFKLQKRLEGTIATMLLLCIQNGNDFIDITDPAAKRRFIDQFTNGGAGLDDSVFSVVTNRRYSSEGMPLDPVILKDVMQSTYHLMNCDITEDLNMDILYNPTLKWTDAETGIGNECGGTGSVAPVSAPYGAARKDKDEDEEIAASEAPNNTAACTTANACNNRRNRNDEENAKRRMGAIEKKCDDTAPTIVSSEIILKNADGSVGGTTTVAFGVKTTVHMLPAVDLAEAIKDTYAESSVLVRFIRWRAGELSFVKDVLLNLKEIKQTVRHRTGRSGGYSPKDIFASMRFKTKNGIMMNASAETRSGQMLPTAILVVSPDEVEEVKRTCGKDFFKNMKDARELCDKLGLFGIVVVEAATNSYYSFFDDGAVNYEKHSLKKESKDDDEGIVRSIFGALRR